MNPYDDDGSDESQEEQKALGIRAQEALLSISYLLRN